MKLAVFSKSRTFDRFLEGHLDEEFELFSRLQAPEKDPQRLYLLHLSSMKFAGFEWMSRHVSAKTIPVAVCSDVPGIGEMLECVRLGARAYCNSHMTAAHYQQMLRLLGEGQSWFPPHLLDETFRLAQNATQAVSPDQLLQCLTNREREIALAVCEGKTNRQVADLHSIAESTVKTHLTNIYKKLDVRDRVSLLLLLKQA